MTNDQDDNSRSDYSTLVRIPTRWNDYDMLGHVNNVQYYRYFEIVVLRLLANSGLDWFRDPVIPFAVENLCRFRRPLGVTDSVEAGIRVARIGRSSATYEIALFMPGNDQPSAYGHFVHVFVDRATERPAEIPQKIRAAFEGERIKAESERYDAIELSTVFPSSSDDPSS